MRWFLVNSGWKYTVKSAKESQNKMKKGEKEELEEELNLLFAETLKLEDELSSFIVNRK